MGLQFESIFNSIYPTEFPCVPRLWGPGERLKLVKKHGWLRFCRLAGYSSEAIVSYNWKRGLIEFLQAKSIILQWQLYSSIICLLFFLVPMFWYQNLFLQPVWLLHPIRMNGDYILENCPLAVIFEVICFLPHIATVVSLRYSGSSAREEKMDLGFSLHLLIFL